MRSRSPIKTLAILTAAAALGAGGGMAQMLPVNASNNSIEKGAILRLIRQPSKREQKLILAGASRFRTRAPWPYRGKNRAQRQRLSAGFMAMS